MEKSRERVKWVDALKFLGIFAIYLGHFGTHVGKLYPFVSLYHIQLFFFASGFFARSADKPLLVYYKQKAFQLMLPYVAFSIIAVLYFSILQHWELSQIINVGTEFLIGTRTKIYAETLWFFPCLFFISVWHYTILKFTKSIYIPFFISIIIFIITQTLLYNNPMQKPSWFMNIDSAMYYYIFYATGAVLFPQISRKFLSMSNWQKALRVIITVFSISFAVACFILGGGWFVTRLINIFPYLMRYGSIIHLFSLLPIALIIIYFNVWVAKCIFRISLLQRMGKQTLIFCGTEKVYKDFFLRFTSLFGWDRSFPSHTWTVIYCFGCLVASHYTAVPVLGKYIPRLAKVIKIRIFNKLANN